MSENVTVIPRRTCSLDHILLSLFVKNSVCPQDYRFLADLGNLIIIKAGYYPSHQTPLERDILGFAKTKNNGACLEALHYASDVEVLGVQDQSF